jgi:pyruvate formate lyase activating enzyme
MVLGGLQKNSMIDYPGKVACVLFMSGCNFNCPYCHNPGLAKGSCDAPAGLTQNVLDDFLTRRQGLLDGVVISGGEPTLQTDIVGVCEKVKKMGYPVKLDTNGSRPAVVAKLVAEDLVDYIAMDIKTDPFNYAPLVQKKDASAEILKSIDIIMSSGLDYEFRTTCVKPLIDADIIKSIVKHISHAKRFALQQFVEHTVLNPDFFNNDDAIYDHEDLLYFKSIAEPWVQECIVR